MKTMEQFYEEVKADEALQKALQAAVESDTAEAFLKEQQVDATIEALEAYGKEKIGELTDDELEAVAGGIIAWGSEGKASRPEDVTFEFQIGDRVEVYGGWLFHTFTNRATILDRRVKLKEGYYRPSYLVRFDKENWGEHWRYQDYLSH